MSRYALKFALLLCISMSLGVRVVVEGRRIDLDLADAAEQLDTDSSEDFTSRASRQDSVRTFRVQKRSTREDVAWHGEYGSCSTGCGRGTRALTGMICKKAGFLSAAQEALSSEPAEVARHLCESESDLAMPASSIVCASDERCELRLGPDPESACGWKNVFCAEQGKPDPEGSTEDPLAEFCMSARKRHWFPLPDKVDYKYRHGLVTSGCPEQTLQSMCVVTINQMSKNKPFANYTANLKQAFYKAEDAITKCNSDIVILAVQEMTNTYKDMFGEFAAGPRGNGIAPSVYQEVGRCGGEISSGVVVLAKFAALEFIAPLLADSCQKDDSKYGGKGAFTNTKGTVFLEILTVRGLLLAASTHGTHGNKPQPRLDMISAASRRITDMKPAMVAWAGDFNMRTETDAVQEKLIRLGTPHPKPSELSESRVDETPSGELDADAAYQMLHQIPDTFAAGQTFAHVIKETSGGFLEEVPGVRNLCPTYKKRASEGSFKPNGKTLPNKKSGMFNLFNAKQYGWNPSFACRSPGSPHGVEYYTNPADGRSKWPKHAPSWTERVVVHTGGVPKCGPPQKAVPLSSDDHDALFVSCQL